MTDGGEGSSGFSHSEYSKERIRQAMSNRVVSEKTKEKLSRIQRTKQIISNLGEIFRCGNDAANFLKENGFEKAHQSGVCNVVGKFGKSAYGRTWNFLEDGIPSWNPQKRNAPNKKRVVRLSDGVVFDSATDAAIACGKACNSNIIMCCKGKIKTAHGHRWSYA